MKLGIVVVYMFNEENAPLLDLHTSHIEKHTTVPYVIYAGVNRLAPQFRERLARCPRIKICEIPDTPLRGMEEHSYYLSHLVETAVRDGATHIVTMHLDSFPIRSGWAEKLAGRLSDSTALATIEHIHTACLFFHRNFYLNYKPAFLLTETERAAPKYKQYLKEHHPYEHSGIGYGFMAFSKGLSCYYLPNTTRAHPLRGAVYDDLIFHLRGAVFVGEHEWSEADITYNPSYLPALRLIQSAGRFIFHKAVRKSLRARFPELTERLWDRPTIYSEWRQVKQIRQELLENPDVYVGLSGKREE